MTEKERIYQLLYNQYIEALKELNNQCALLSLHRERTEGTKKCIDIFKSE